MAVSEALIILLLFDPPSVFSVMPAEGTVPKPGVSVCVIILLDSVFQMDIKSVGIFLKSETRIYRKNGEK
jgi:hypothetical protein